MAHLDLAPGRHIGLLLERLSEAQAAGEIASEADALELAATLVHEMDVQS